MHAAPSGRQALGVPPDSCTASSLARPPARPLQPLVRDGRMDKFYFEPTRGEMAEALLALFAPALGRPEVKIKGHAAHDARAAVAQEHAHCAAQSRLLWALLALELCPACAGDLQYHERAETILQK